MHLSQSLRSGLHGPCQSYHYSEPRSRPLQRNVSEDAAPSTESQQMDRRLKPLRPAIPSPTPSESGQASRSQSAAPFRRRKRVQVKVACDVCRLKKSACDGLRPICSACVRRSSSCTFGGRPVENPDLSPSLTPKESERNSEAADVIGLLISAPADEALDMLIELRSQYDTSAALRRIRYNRELHEYNLPSFFPPPDQESTEFELMTRHPVLYPVSIPLDFPQPSIPSTRQQSQTRSVESDLYGGGNSESSPGPNFGVPDSRRLDASPILNPSLTIDSSISPELDGPSTQMLYDPRLERVNFSTWTDIPVLHSEAAQAISDYLRLDNPVLGFFDADPFLNDLSSNGTRYCSPLLVNALLGWRCASQPGLVNDFYHTALSLLSPSAESDSLMQLAALELLSLTATYQGHGKMATKLLGQAIDMGKRMQLLSDRPTGSNLQAHTGPDVRAASYAAWGLFSYATLHSLHCQQCDLGAATSPPALPIPLSSEPDRWSKSAASGISSYPALSFEHLCRLCVIIHDMVVRYYARDDRQPGQQDAAQMDFVGGMFRRFFRWGHDLPLSLTRGNKSTHDGLILHIYFHAAIISLFRPLTIHQQHVQNLGLSAADAHPAEAISRASVSQLKRLMVSYQSRAPGEVSTVHWHIACLYVANAMIRGHGQYKGRWSYFSRCLEGYKMLYPRYAVTVPIFKGLLSMAMSNGIITSQEAYDAFGQLLANKGGLQHHSSIVEPTECFFVIDLDLALTDVVAAHIDSLAQKFDDMVMFENFTHGRADEDGVVSVALPNSF